MVHTGLPALLEYVPLPQGVHCVAPYGEKVPAGHGIATESGAHALPAGHGGQGVPMNPVGRCVPGSGHAINLPTHFLSVGQLRPGKVHCVLGGHGMGVFSTQ